MSDSVSKFEYHRKQLATGLVAVAESMRNCAQLADTFAKVVADAHYSHEAAVFFQDASEATKGKRKAAHSPEEGEVPKKRKRTIKPKDPNAPKRPASSYLLFQNEVRKELKEQHPNLSNTDLLSLISEQWKNMSEEQKETYNQLMKTAKAQYSEEKKAYDSRNVAETEAANVTNAAAGTQKTSPKARGRKLSAAAGTSGAKVSPATTARPPPKVSEASHSSDTSEGEESEDEAPSKAAKQHEHGSESSEEESSEPTPKKRHGGSAKPNSQKLKKGLAT